jgi:hypothetical protein
MSTTVIFSVKGGKPGDHIFWCQGCEYAHGIDSGWSFNGDLAKPTVSPSLLSQGEKRCHLFIREGRLEFLSDCDHALAGQTVDMAPFPWKIETPQDESSEDRTV